MVKLLVLVSLGIVLAGCLRTSVECTSSGTIKTASCNDYTANGTGNCAEIYKAQEHACAANINLKLEGMNGNK